MSATVEPPSRNWSECEKTLLATYVVDGRVEKHSPVDKIPADLVAQLPRRTPEAIRLYVYRNTEALLARALACGEAVECLDASPKKRGRGRPTLESKAAEAEEAAKMQDVLAEMEAAFAAAPETPVEKKHKAGHVTPPKPRLTAQVEVPPPEMVPPLPRTITFGAKRMTLQSYGAHGLTLVGTSSVFEDINRKLGMHRDARMESWDGLPRFM